MFMYRIGIDPDIENNGYCILEKKPFSKIEIKFMANLDFFEVIESIKVNSIAHFGNYIVCIEAGWLNENRNFHKKAINKAANKITLARGFAAAERAREKMNDMVASKVGQNFAVGQLFEQYCKKHKINYMLYQPSSSKWDARLFKQATGWTGRTNQEVRDAVRAAWI